MNTLVHYAGIFGFAANAIDLSGQSQNVAQPMSSMNSLEPMTLYAYNENNLRAQGCHL